MLYSHSYETKLMMINITFKIITSIILYVTNLQAMYLSS